MRSSANPSGPEVASMSRRLSNLEALFEEKIIALEGKVVSLQNQMNDMLQRLCSLHEANEAQFEDLYAIVGKTNAGAAHPTKTAADPSPEYVRITAQVEELQARLNRMDQIARPRSPPKIPQPRAAPPPDIQARRLSEDSSTSSKANTPLAGDLSRGHTQSPFNTISPSAKHSMASLTRSCAATRPSANMGSSSQPPLKQHHSPQTAALGHVDPSLTHGSRGASPEMRRVPSDSHLRRNAPPPVALPKGASPSKVATKSPQSHVGALLPQQAPAPAPAAAPAAGAASMPQHARSTTSPQSQSPDTRLSPQPGTPGSGRHEPRTTRDKRKQPHQSLTAAALSTHGAPSQAQPPRHHAAPRAATAAGFGAASIDSDLTFDTSSEHSSDCM